MTDSLDLVSVLLMLIFGKSLLGVVTGRVFAGTLELRVFDCIDSYYEACFIAPTFEGVLSLVVNDGFVIFFNYSNYWAWFYPLV